MLTQYEKQSKISQCLQCPICHQVIFDYITYFYPRWKEHRKSNANYEKLKEAIRCISESLKINLDFEQINIENPKERKMKIEKEYGKAINALIRFSTNEKLPYSLFEERFDCASIIKRILSQIIDINEKSFPVQTINDECLLILDIMEQISCPDSLDRTNSKYRKKSYSEEEYDFGTVITEYCDNFDDYKFCDSSFDEFEEYDNLRDCRSAMFEVIAKIQEPKAVLNVDGLNSHSMRIFHEFIMRTPKSFGYNLSTVMRLQGFTHQDLANVLGLEKARPIQSLCESKTTTSPQIDIHRLAQALLISEDVLYCGAGKIYGIWDEILSEYSKTNLEKMSHKESTLARAEKLAIISDVVKMKPDTFLQMVNDESDFFHESPYCVYIENWEGECFFDYSEMVNQALHQEEIQLLISALIKCQNEEKD